MNMHEIMKRIEGYAYTCEGGALENCTEWQALKEMANAPMHLIPLAPLEIRINKSDLGVLVEAILTSGQLSDPARTAHMILRDREESFRSLVPEGFEVRS